MPHPCLAQSAKQGFCFSWDSAWLLRFTQEETSRKPESQLKKTRSSNHKTGHLLRCRRDPYFISSKLGFQFQANIPPGATSGIKQKPSLEDMKPKSDRSNSGFALAWVPHPTGRFRPPTRRNQAKATTQPNQENPPAHYHTSSKLDFHIQPRHTPRKHIHYQPELKLRRYAAQQAGLLL